MPQTHLCATAYTRRSQLAYIVRLLVAHIERSRVAHIGRSPVAHIERLRVAHTTRLCMDQYNPVNDELNAIRTNLVETSIGQCVACLI